MLEMADLQERSLSFGIVSGYELPATYMCRLGRNGLKVVLQTVPTG